MAFVKKSQKNISDVNQGVSCLRDANDNYTFIISLEEHTLIFAKDQILLYNYDQMFID